MLCGAQAHPVESGTCTPSVSNPDRLIFKFISRSNPSSIDAIVRHDITALLSLMDAVLDGGGHNSPLGVKHHVSDIALIGAGMTLSNKHIRVIVSKSVL